MKLISGGNEESFLSLRLWIGRVQIAINRVFQPVAIFKYTGFIALII
jgi:hypothetical protein